MKAVICFLYFILSLLFSFGQKIDTVNIFSRYFNSNRQIFIYRPDNYDNNPKQYYEVIYVFDAHIYEYARLVYFNQPFLAHSLFSTILVGISSEENRNKDFLPTKDFPPETFSEKRGNFGDADKFLNFITNEVDSVVSKKYRTFPKRIAIGHSLAATFLSYCLLQKPDFFDAYIAISPNFAYDRFQFIRRFKNFDVSNIKLKKFVYMINSNEETDFTYSWKTGRDSINHILSGNNFKTKIKFINQDFSKTENHTTIYPLGVRNGLKLVFDYYHNADYLMSFYEEMNKQNKFELTPVNTNYMAYNFLWSHKPKEALKIIQWANHLFPDDLNIIDGMGEIYQQNGDKKNATKYYRLFEKRLERQKAKLTSEKFDELKSNHKERVKSINK